MCTSVMGDVFLRRLDVTDVTALAGVITWMLVY